MSTISHNKYLEALNVIQEYKKQIKEQNKKDNFFGFLWFNNDGAMSQRWIKATSIESACEKFLKIKPKSLSSLDYEVANGNTFIDISENKTIKHLIS